MKSQRTLPFSRRPPGFTLTESLVVLLIVAALAVLAMLSLGKARETADNAHCVANLRRLGIAGNSHVTEHGSYPPNGGTGSGSETKFWFKDIEVELGFRPGTSPAVIERAEAMPKCRTCLKNHGGGTNPNNRSIRTYSMNHRLLAPTMAATGRMGFPGMRATLAENPAKTMFFSDGVLVGPQPYWDFLTRPGAWLVPTNFIHNGRANIVFLDGHVESRRMDEVPGDTGHAFWDPKATGNP